MKSEAAPGSTFLFTFMKGNHAMSTSDQFINSFIKSQRWWKLGRGIALRDDVYRKIATVYVAHTMAQLETVWMCCFWDLPHLLVKDRIVELLQWCIMDRESALHLGDVTTPSAAVVYTLVQKQHAQLTVWKRKANPKLWWKKFYQREDRFWCLKNLWGFTG